MNKTDQRFPIVTTKEIAMYLTKGCTMATLASVLPQDFAVRNRFRMNPYTWRLEFKGYHDAEWRVRDAPPRTVAQWIRIAYMAWGRFGALTIEPDTHGLYHPPYSRKLPQ